MIVEGDLLAEKIKQDQYNDVVEFLYLLLTLLVIYMFIRSQKLSHPLKYIRLMTTNKPISTDIRIIY